MDFAIGISIVALIVAAFPILKYYLVERGRVDVFMSHFTHKHRKDAKIVTKDHPIICIKNIGKTPVKDLKCRIIEQESILSEDNKNALKGRYPITVLEPNVERMIYIFDPKTSDEKMDIFIMGKDRTESICIEARYKDIFGIPHTEIFRFPFYSNRYQPKTEIQEISSWLRNIRDEMRAISSNLGVISNEIRNSKKNQVN